jgi:hypothetical protein
MAALSKLVKAFIVDSLAAYQKQKAVADAVQAEFGITVTRQQVDAYLPGSVSAKSLSQEWIDRFHASRKAFLENIDAIPVTHKAVRLQALQRMAEKAEDQGNMVLAAQFLEQIAKECGDAYSNRRRVEFDGKLETTRKTKAMTDEELLAIAEGGG